MRSLTVAVACNLFKEFVQMHKLITLYDYAKGLPVKETLPKFDTSIKVTNAYMLLQTPICTCSICMFLPYIQLRAGAFDC